MSIESVMKADHRRCDELYSAVEEAAGAGDPAAAKKAATAFIEASERHFTLEEESLFPALEARFPGALGPTTVMRHEHAQLRDAFEQLGAALAAGDLDESLGLLESMLVLLQQHNLKEERILYPMMDAQLGAHGAQLVASLAPA
jgi:hemerythrin-like domain-containing protein